MKTAAEIQNDVLEELRWEASLDAAGIGVAVHDGTVTLSGHVHSLAEKLAAERAAKRVAGVHGVADELTVKLVDSSERDDTDIAEMVLRNLKWNSLVPAEGIRVTVDDGWVTLEGEVEWKYQRNEAEKAVVFLSGVKGVTNLLHIMPRVTPRGIEAKIHDAFRRHADIDSAQIFVETDNGKVILRGRVRSWAEYQDAEWAAWSAPGVTQVENHLSIRLGEGAAV